MRSITLVLDDRVGLLAEISSLLGKAGVNIDSVSVSSFGSKAIHTYLVDDEQSARKVLSTNGYNALTSDILVLQLPDKPGGFSAASSRLAAAKININRLSIIAREGGSVRFAIGVSDPEKAKKALAEFVLK
ncbi:MAG: ACT domain-containing protein [Candidatus Micrarchaeia archaeon]